MEDQVTINPYEHCFHLRLSTEEVVTKKIFTLSVALSLLLNSTLLLAGFGKNYCHVEGFTCIKVKKGQSWHSLWPDPYQRDLVQRLNRTNISLYPGMLVAVPKNLETLDVRDVAPFVQHAPALPEKTVIVSPRLLAWGAYDPEGNLVKWGPISGGKDYCPDVNRNCRSKTGSFYIYEKRGPECISTKFPVDTAGGAPMPYCMFYSGGFALHGSPQVPGYHASHGCIRLFTEDARWLNYEFTAEGKTQVIVLPY